MWRFLITTMFLLGATVTIVYAVFFWQQSTGSLLTIEGYPTRYQPGQQLQVEWLSDQTIDVETVRLIFEQEGRRLEGETETRATFEGYVSSRAVPDLASDHALTLYLELDHAGRTYASEALTIPSRTPPSRAPIVEMDGELDPGFGLDNSHREGGDEADTDVVPDVEEQQEPSATSNEQGGNDDVSVGGSTETIEAPTDSQWQY